MILYRNKQKFIDEAKSRIPDFDEQLISRTWDFARQTYANRQQQQEDQEIDASRPFGVAHNLLAIECDSSMMAAALLYDLVGSKITNIKEIKKRFGADVARLVEGVARLAPLDMPPGKPWMHANVRKETLRKFFVAIVDDPRVALIKLADRLYRLTTFGALTEERKRKMAQESLDVFAPLAEALELGTVQSRIQELAFRYLEPETYRHLEQRLRERWEECKKLRDIAVRSLEDDLAKAGINASVYDRKKEIYSIHQKMQSYKLKFEEVYDIIGIRIIVDTEEDCYKAKLIVDQLGTEVKYNDWIHKPRGQGGYQSLHKVVQETGGALFEIQIRSKEMHLQAERGSAAHWIYKLGGTSHQPEIVKKINTLRETLEKTMGMADKSRTSSSESLGEHDLKEIGRTPGIHVFTPAGDVILLPEGSTLLDFAYRIHTIVGHECRGAWVKRSTWIKRKYVPLDYELDDGDIVQIDRRKGAAPRLSWITEGKVRSPQAQHGIRQYFLAQKRTEMVADARNLVREQLKWFSDLHLETRDLLNACVQTKLLNEQTDEEGLYLAIADRKISADRLQKIIGEVVVKRCLIDEGLSKEFVWKLVKWFAEHENLSPSREEALFLSVAKRNISVKLLQQAIGDLAVSVSALSNIGNSTVQTVSEDSSPDYSLSFHAAQCCYPLPGDNIVGLLTVGHGLSVHRGTCPQVSTSGKLRPVVSITWEDLSVPKQCTFSSRLFVTVAGYDPRKHRKIQDVLLKADAIIREDAVIGASQMRFIIGVRNVDHLGTIQNRLKQIEGVIEVNRQESPRQTASAGGTVRSMDRS